MSKESDQFQITPNIFVHMSQCLQTYPCQHVVTQNGTTQTMSASDIYDIMVLHDNLHPHFAYMIPKDQFGRRFCGCCGDAEKILREKPINTHAGFLDVIKSKTFLDLHDGGKNVVLMCLYYLHLDKTENEIEHTRERYITLWSFITDFLKVATKDDGYDYWLLNWLEWNELIEHGCAIRCPWITKKGTELILQNINSVVQYRDDIIKWAKTANPD